MKSSRNAFEFLINHVILPAKLPQQEEKTDIERSGEQLLLQLLSETLDLFLTKSSSEARENWKPVCYALRGLWDMTNGSLDSKAAMEKNLKNLKPSGPSISNHYCKFELIISRCHDRFRSSTELGTSSLP